MFKLIYILFWYLFLSFFVVFQSKASDYGTTGIIDVPSARMQNDGVLSTNITKDDLLESYALTYQAFDWLEGTFRYTGYNNFFYWDRNYELKARILRESDVMPEISIGIRDLVGTGVFGSEYLVGSKKYQNFDFTLGVGWGRLADKSTLTNPLSQLSTRFGTRSVDYGEGGTLSTDDFFSGSDIGLFGGIRYRFTDYPVTLLLEYNPDESLWETQRLGFPKVKNPISYGLVWHVSDNIEIRLNHKHLESFGIGIQTRLDTKKIPTKYEVTQYLSSLDMQASQLPEGLNPDLWYDTFLYDLERSDLFVKQARLFPSQKKAQIEIINDAYPYWPDAINRAHVLASLHLPQYITTIEYLINDQGHVVQTVSLPRQKQYGTEKITVSSHAKILPTKIIKDPHHTTNFVKNNVFMDATIANRFMLFDPDNPFSIQFYLKLATKIDLYNDWKLRASYRYDLWNNLSELNRRSNSVLPKVRSDALRYLQEGENGIENLFLEKRGTFTAQSNLHYRFYGGILEDMYSGIGGEVLYQPNASRLAFSISGAYAKQRDFAGGLEHLDYDVLTAHASVYWATPYENYDLAVHAGRYLAKDIGATLEVRRTFNNGWQLGLWATFTDVSFEDFGEGSFDKGIFFRIPFDNVLSTSRKSVYKTRIRPIQRDGGARLEGYSGELWWELRDARFDVFNQVSRD